MAISGRGFFLGLNDGGYVEAYDAIPCVTKCSRPSGTPSYGSFKCNTDETAVVNKVMSSVDGGQVTFEAVYSETLMSRLLAVEGLQYYLDETDEPDFDRPVKFRYRPPTGSSAVSDLYADFEGVVTLALDADPMVAPVIIVGTIEVMSAPEWGTSAP